MARTFRPRPGSGTTLLPLVGAVGEGLIFAITLLLARSLPHTEFQAYVLAASLFAVLSGLAPFGADQLILKVLPTMSDPEKSSFRAGFLRFVMRRAATGTALATILGALWLLAVTNAGSAVRNAGIMALAGLPLAVIAHIGVEMQTVHGHPVRSLAALRFVMPGAALAVLSPLAVLDLLPDAAGVVAIWGIGWLAALLFLRRALATLWHSFRTRTTSRQDRRIWSRIAFPLWARRTAIAIGTQAGLLSLGWAETATPEILSFALASSVASLALISSTATHRVYSRDLAPLVQLQDALGVRLLLATRLRRVAPFSGLILAAMVFVPETVFAFFDFSADVKSMIVLRLLATSAGLTAWLGVYTTVLIYAGYSRLATLCTVAGISTLLAGLALLVPLHGAVGAATAQTIAALVSLGLPALLVRRLLRGWE